MKSISKKYPEYNFDINKGYGTKNHRDKIKKHGLCILHRKTFCTGMTELDLNVIM